MIIAAAAIGVVALGVPSWAALGAGVVVALVSGEHPPARWRSLTTPALQLGVVALGAGMNLVTIAHLGASGALMTMLSIGAALLAGAALGTLLRIPGRTPLLISVGTAICGGSAIAAVASILRPREQETSVALAVVFLLNAVGLVAFPLVGHALGLSELTFGRWAALGIHDTSSVVGAGLVYGPHALAVATTTKLARALWIVPLSLGIALATRARAAAPLVPASTEPAAPPAQPGARWPWFILGFLALAALFTWVPALAPAAPVIVLGGQRMLLLALFLIGLSLSRRALAQVGARPLVMGVILWVVVAAWSLWLAR